MSTTNQASGLNNREGHRHRSTWFKLTERNLSIQRPKAVAIAGSRSQHSNQGQKRTLPHTLCATMLQCWLMVSSVMPTMDPPSACSGWGILYALPHITEQQLLGLPIE